MKQLTRIVTWMGYPPMGNPQQLLEQGSNTYQLGDKIRLYAVRKVTYDESLTPVFATPIPIEFPVTDIKELSKVEAESGVINAPVLDLDNYLKVYKP